MMVPPVMTVSNSAMALPHFSAVSAAQVLGAHRLRFWAGRWAQNSTMR